MNEHFEKRICGIWNLQPRDAGCEGNLQDPSAAAGNPGQTGTLSRVPNWWC